MTVECSADSCTKTARTMGWCSAHYQAARKAGLTPSQPCGLDGCERPHYGRGFCAPHYEMNKRAGNFSAGVICAIEGCIRTVYAVDKCHLHYQRLQVAGDVGPAKAFRRGNGRAWARQDGLKECGACLEWLPESEFRVNRGMRDGLASSCSRCTKDAQYRRAWKMSLSEAEDRLRAQGGCEICGTTTPGLKGWCVDHDHACCPGRKSCGKCVRGILCGSCNPSLGGFGDSIENLTSAIAYLRKYSN